MTLLQGVPTLRISVSAGRRAKFIRESEDIAGNREPPELIRETANNIGILHNIFGGCI